ncbi:MAG: hypothetical protein PHW60_01140 [Kiritimatiellae bacterium]|nr:hypothetical protein [Kiritimatiellia bacterium]
MITIEISKDDASPALDRLQDSLEGPAIQESMGRAGVNLLQDHFKTLADERHRDAAPHNFYADAARSTHHFTTHDSVILSISKTGIAQRYFGGTIKPVNAKYLTISARDETVGRRAREFNNLEMLFGRNGPYALAERQSTDIRWRSAKAQKGWAHNPGKYRYAAAGATRGGGIFFWLVESVTQESDPTVLPEMETILEVVRQAASDYIAVKTEGVNQ